MARIALPVVVFTVANLVAVSFRNAFALDVAALELPARFTAGDVLQAMQGHVLAEALVYGTYTLNPSLRE